VRKLLFLHVALFSFRNDRLSLTLSLRPFIYDIYLLLIVATRYRIDNLYRLLSETLL